jgi:hypothetical protein
MIDFLKVNRVVIITTIALFLILIAGYLTSPTFAEEQSFLEAIGTFIGLIFAFSVVVVLSALGFSSFALFLALFLAMAISLYGVRAGVIAIAMSYFVWGLVFSIELLLVNDGNQGAIKWFQERYNFKSFELEYRAFYPMIWLFFLLFEIIPHYLFGDRLVQFHPETIKKKMREILKQ